MSGRYGRSETSWERKEGKWSNSETSDDTPPRNFSRRQSWEPLKGNRIVPDDGDVPRDRHRMHMNPAFDDWEEQYSTHPSDDSYNMPYRSRDRGVGDVARVSRDQNQTRSPSRSRSRSPRRDGARFVSRSRSRSRNRDRENTRARSRSPFYDDRRHESNEYPSLRNNSRLSSRGDKHLDNNLTEYQSRQPDHTGGSRYNDYHRDDRNSYDDQNKRCQSNRNSRVPCRFFLAGNCNRDDCRFSHDVPESGSYDGRSHDSNRDHNFGNKNREWHDRHPDECVNPSDFSDIPKSNFGEKKTTWNGPLWDNVESGGFGQKSMQGYNSDDKRKLWDRPSRDNADASGFQDARKSNPNLENKNRSRNGPSCNSKEFEDSIKSRNGPKSGISNDMRKLRNGPSWDDVDTPGFPDAEKSNPIFDNRNRSRNGPSQDSKKFEDNKKSWSGAKSESSDDMRKLWDGPSWDDVAAPGFPDAGKSNSILDNTNRSRNGPCHDSKKFEDSNKSWNGARSGNSDDMRNSWDGTSWDDVDTSGFPNVGKSNPNLNNKNRKGNGPSWDTTNYEGSKKSWNGAKPGNDTDGKTKEWNGPSWDDVDFGKSGGGDGTSSATNDKIRKFDGPGFSEMASEKNNYILPQWTSVTNVTDLQLHTMDVQEQHVMPQALSSPYVNANTPVMPEVPVVSSHFKHRIQEDQNMQLNANISENANQQVLNSGNDSIQNVRDMYLTGTEIPLNRPKIQSNGQVQGTFGHMDSHKQSEDWNRENGELPKPSDIDDPQAKNDINALPASLPEMSQKGQIPQQYADLNLTNAIDYLKSLPNPAYSQDTRTKEEQTSAIIMEVKTSVPMGILCGSVSQENQNRMENLPKNGVMEKEPPGNLERPDNNVVDTDKQEQENINLHNSEAQGNEEGDIGNDEKAMRQFKISLVDFVKEILKPKWKEGKLSRDVHKTVVKKVLDKVTGTIQGIQIPRTPAKIEQYLAYSKPKITKLVEAYVERLLKA